MAQQFDYPKSETDLRSTLDAMYQTSKTAYKSGGRPSFKGLIEIMSAQATIITAIHNIKSNKGSKTPGVDNATMQTDYLQKPFSWVVQDIQNAFRWYKPQKIRREYIDKPGKPEKRPLGIPTIRDRIVQECVRIVLEPIAEAQFFRHSYGFRPMRDTKMALWRITDLVHATGYYWIVEGDISKCFDRINHNILLKRLYHLGIKDRRVIQMVKAMLKAGVIGESEINEDGTQQGGILSPLLANVTLDILDEWVSRQWEEKKTNINYARRDIKLFALRKRSSLIPGYLVRYADDFVIITDTREHAESWKRRLQEFLLTDMRLALSPEKTLITDVRKKCIHFLGYEYKVVRGKALKGHICRSSPDRVRLKRKIDEIANDIRRIPTGASREQAIHRINLINSKIRGLVNYYENCTWVYVAMKKHARILMLAASRQLRKYKGKWIPANQTQNLSHIHEKYKQKIPSIKFNDMWIGLTSLTFCKWEKPTGKNPNETPYTEDGRRINFDRTKKKRKLARLDSVLTEQESVIASTEAKGKLYNFEFYMNRAYALNRDKLKCRLCGGWLITSTPYTHRINPNLPLNLVNKVSNMASMHRNCSKMVYDLNLDITQLETGIRRKLQFFRERLGNNTCKTTT